MSLVLHRTTLVDLEATSTLASGVWLEPFAAWLWWSNWCSACQFLDVFWPPESWSHFPSVIGVDSFFCEELQWNCGGMKKVDSNTLKHRSRAQRSWGMEERAMKLRCLDLDSPHLQPEVAAKAWMAWAELLNWDMFFFFFSGERQKGLGRSPSSHELGCVRFNSLDSQIPWLPTQNKRPGEIPRVPKTQFIVRNWTHVLLFLHEISRCYCAHPFCMCYGKIMENPWKSKIFGEFQKPIV